MILDGVVDDVSSRICCNSLAKIALIKDQIKNDVHLVSEIYANYSREVTRTRKTSEHFIMTNNSNNSLPEHDDVPNKRGRANDGGKQGSPGFTNSMHPMPMHPMLPIPNTASTIASSTDSILSGTVPNTVSTPFCPF